MSLLERHPLSTAEIWSVINNIKTVQLVLFTNKKSCTRFRLVPKVVTLNDLEPHNDRYFASLYPKAVYFAANCWNYIKLSEAGSICLRQQYNPKIPGFGLRTAARTRAAVLFSWKLTHPHLFTVGVVQHCAAISATAERLFIDCACDYRIAWADLLVCC